MGEPGPHDVDDLRPVSVAGRHPWLCEGQIEELRHTYDIARSESSYLASIHGKTASLFGTAARIGSIVAGLDRPTIDAVTEYGNAYGMNSVLYHLHPVKVKRHAVKVSYTLCLGGLSFFLFILLTVTGIFLMFFYRPEATAAWNDISNLQTSVTFGLLVRNMTAAGCPPSEGANMCTGA